MKKIIIFIFCCIFMTSCVNENHDASQPERFEKMQHGSAAPILNDKKNNADDINMYNPINYDTQKAVWISYIDLSDMLTGKNESEFYYNFKKACQNISELGCNTIYLHLRPFGDALYNSELYPASRYVTGQPGTKPDFDPLEIMLETAHGYELSVHGWINPLRCESEVAFENYSSNYLIKQWYDEDCGKIEKVDGDEHLWLNPAYGEVRQLIADGAGEIVKNYEIDGIHFDDYFYPTTDTSFDEQCFLQHGGESLSEWRMENISEMVKAIYEKVKSINSEILVGVSPQGNIENNYSYMYADVKKWCLNDGYIDYIVPQIYFGYENTVKPFEKTVREWSDIAANGNVKLIAGLGVYKIYQNDEKEFFNTEGIIGMQIEDSMEKFDCSGVALYNYINLFEPSEEQSVRTSAELKCIEKSLDKQ